MKLCRALLLVAIGLGLAGCGDAPKTEIPTDLNKPLPPPPVLGGSGSKAKPQLPSNNAQ